MRNALSKVGDTARRLGRSRITAALLGAALVALVGGGTAVASGHIGGDDIRNYSIDKQHLKKDSVGSWEAKDRSLSGGDLRFDSVGQRVFTPRLRELINEGKEGPQGEPGQDGTDGTDGQDGADGTNGADGQDGVSGYEAIGRTADRVEVAKGKTVVVETLCASEDSGEQQHAEMALGGGAKTVSGTVTIGGSYPHAIDQFSEPDEDDPAGRWGAGGWAVQVTNIGDGPASVQPYVLCALMN